MPDDDDDRDSSSHTSACCVITSLVVHPPIKSSRIMRLPGNGGVAGHLQHYGQERPKQLAQPSSQPEMTCDALQINHASAQHPTSVLVLAL
jgi:hypothetical protein